MAGSLIYAPLQNNRELRRRARDVEAWPVEKFIIHKVLLLDRFFLGIGSVITGVWKKMNIKLSFLMRYDIFGEI